MGAIFLLDKNRRIVKEKNSKNKAPVSVGIMIPENFLTFLLTFFNIEIYKINRVPVLISVVLEFVH